MLGLARKKRANTEPGRQPTTAPEEWRVLRLLSLYRLMLVAVLIVAIKSGFAPRIFDSLAGSQLQMAALAYGVVALLLMALVQQRRPHLETQAHLHLLGDLSSLSLLIYACGGVPTGLGALVITPVVGGALVLSPRMAMLQAALATIAMFGVEIARRYDQRFDANDFTAAGVLGLMLFGASIAANAVAQRARKSEALAEQVGSEFADLSELNESIVSGMYTGVLVVDPDRRIRRLNPAARRLMQLSGEAENRLIELEAPALASRLRQWRIDGIASGAPIASRPGAAEVVPRFSRLGSGLRAPILVLLEDAGLMREQAQQMKLAALGRLSANIAHEIRNPLSAIHQASQLLAEAEVFVDDGQAQNRRLLDMIQRHGRRIDKIVQDVLAMSRREPPQPVSARAERLSGARQPACTRKAIRTARGRSKFLDMPGDSLQVRFDPNHLQQILFNLWDNAFLHGGNNGVLVLLDAGIDEQQHAWLEVSDNGPGIAENLRERMFEPFFTTAHQGTGLGLFLTRELCEYNQARIAYRPADSGGACFRLTFAHIAAAA
jgi:two-component system sensor histidine kinase PilS (NtrC family)